MAMASVQRHRGPDGQGQNTIETGQFYSTLAHQRLAILDLSPDGAQPMDSRSGRFSISFNGEVYNYLELARKFGLPQLRSKCDTEVVLELIDKLGPERAFTEFNGMWAIALVDRSENKLILSRDRLGIKPLHYLASAESIEVASELKTFLSIETFVPRVNTRTAAKFLSQSLQNVDDETWLEGVSSVPAGHWCEISLSGQRLQPPTFRRFWDITQALSPYRGSFSSYTEELRETLTDAIRLRMRSDVAVGFTLSGGIDSTILAAIGSEHRSSVALFSAVSPGAKGDESNYIDIAADYINSPIYKYDLSDNSGDVLGDIRAQNFQNDAPLASLSGLIFSRLMQCASAEEYKVILSGQGADEVFCGYRKYPIFYLRHLLGSRSFGQASRFFYGLLKQKTLLNQISFAEAKRYLNRPVSSILGDQCIRGYEVEPIGQAASIAVRQQLDIQKFSVPYLTHYEDRMSMAVGREVRLPYLDHRIVELGLSGPEHYKMRSGWTKYCLRRAFENNIPAEIAWRRDKKGFTNPQDKILRGPLRRDLEALANNSSHPIFELGLVDPEAYIKLVNTYLSGDPRVWFREVFGPFSLGLWLEEFGIK